MRNALIQGNEIITVNFKREGYAMKQLICEMCGGTDLVKQDGVYICQSCGTKYSVEEARKMMVEGTVDVSGSTVKVDTSVELANLYQIARRAKDDNNSENAAKYYEMILVKDPTSWEAAFYTVYFKAISCKIIEIQSAAISITNCEKNVLSLIRDNVPETKQYDTVKEVMQRCSLAANMLAGGALKHYEGISPDIKANYIEENSNRLCAALDIIYTCGNQIDIIFSTKRDVAKIAADAWKAGIEMQENIKPYLVATRCFGYIDTYSMKIGKYDSEYANNYSYTIKRNRLEAQIKGLNDTISKTPTEQGLNGVAKFVITLGAINMLLSILLMVINARVNGFSIFMLAIGAGCVLLGVTVLKPDKKVLEQNEKKVADAKVKLAQLEKELRILTSKDQTTT